MKYRRAHEWIADRAGTSVLEFAILAPVFIGLLMAAFNFGYALHCGSSVRHAVERASRLLIMTPTATEADVRTAALAKLDNVPVDNLTISLSTETVTASEQIRRISWTYDYMIYLPFMPDHSLSFGSSMVVPMPPTT